MLHDVLVPFLSSDGKLLSVRQFAALLTPTGRTYHAVEIFLFIIFAGLLERKVRIRIQLPAGQAAVAYDPALGPALRQQDLIRSARKDRTCF